MTWKVTNMEDQKRQFVLLWKTNKFTLSALCRDFGISRPTGYKILQRFEEEGWDALVEQSRRHNSHPNTTPQEMVEAILEIRNKYPRWGARKVVAILEREWESESIPCPSTVNAIMRRHGMTIPRRRSIKKITNQFPVFDPVNPNEIWSADFKGKFRMGNKVYCHPLTIADSKSRYLFAIKGMENPTTEGAKPVFERVFREHGLPLYLHTDNGAPFGSALSLRRMTRLSVWIIEIGITPVYSDPGHPEQNGRHERMHRDLKAAATRPPAGCLVSQQKVFEKFIKEYNNERPHEALNMKTPSDVHIRSTREYPRIIRDWDYPKEITPRYVSGNGAIRWGADGWIMITTALAGKYVGMEEVGTGLWKLYYRHVELGYYEERSNTVYEIEDFDL
jgi:transposase InsO family protein